MEKKRDDDMQVTLTNKKTRQEKIQASFREAVKANGKALEKLSKNG